MTMIDQDPYRAGVCRLLARRVSADELRDLSGGTRLGAEGLGLDSVATVELLLECESEFGVRLPPALLAGPPLTVGRLADELRRAQAHGDVQRRA